MGLDDIKNAVNAELDTEYAETLVGDELLYSDNSQSNAITSETTWDSIYDSVGAQAGFSNDEVISFSGTDRDGNAVSGSYTITNVTSDSVQGLLSAMENAFSSEVNASIDSSGRIVIKDEYAGTSQLSIDYIKDAEENAFFGTPDITAGAGDGSQNGIAAISMNLSKHEFVLWANQQKTLKSGKICPPIHHRCQQFNKSAVGQKFAILFLTKPRIVEHQRHVIAFRL